MADPARLARHLPLLLLGAGTLALAATAWWPRTGAPVALLFPPGVTEDVALLRSLGDADWHPVAVTRRGPLAAVLMVPSVAEASIAGLRRGTGAWLALAASGAASGCLGDAPPAPLPVVTASQQES
jgi:hypothetical protein